MRTDFRETQRASKQGKSSFRWQSNYNRFKLFKLKSFYRWNCQLIEPFPQVYLPDLMMKYKTDEWHRRSRSEAYIHQVAMVSLFYFVPACQLVFTKSKDNEQCYFNYGCARPWWIFEAFNHVFSNIGYIWLGLCFIIIVFLKSRYFPEFVYENFRPVFPDKGLPQQNSIFYAMGIAMVFQVKF